MNARSLPVLLLAVLVLAACGDDEVTEPVTTDLTGSYELLSYEEEGGGGSISPPLASGSLEMSSTAYTMSIDLPETVDPGEIDDAGEYFTDGSEIRLVSSQGMGTSTGIFLFEPTEMENGVLLIDVDRPDGGLRIVTYWAKL